MKKTILAILTLGYIITMTACQSQKESVNTVTGATATAIERPIDNSVMAMPRVVIYKTKADYSNLVPVTMNDDKTKIVSYPDPIDVKTGKRPTALNDGYLLDNFGISKNTVYTDYTYEEYAALEKVPEMDTLLQHIIERNPLTAYYVSNDNYPRGDESRNIETLNRAIADGMKGFTKVVP